MNFNLSGDTNEENRDSVKQQKSKSKKNTSTRSKQVKIADDEYDEDKVFTRSPAKVVVIDDSPSVKDSKQTGETNEKLLSEADVKLPLEKDSEIPKPAQLSPRQKQLLIPRAHMTKGEKRRLQMELEAASIEKLKNENYEKMVKLGLAKDSKMNEANQGEVQRKEKSSEKPQYNDTNSKKKRSSVLIEPDFVPGLGDLSHRDPTSQPELNSVSKPSVKEPDIREPQAVPVVQPLTRAELKRLQWDKEKGR